MKRPPDYSPTAKAFKPRKQLQSELSAMVNGAVYHGHDDENLGLPNRSASSAHRGCRWQGSSVRGVYRRRAPGRSLRVGVQGRPLGGLCADCGGFGFECHHVVPIYLGGPALPGPDGLVWLCRACHFKRHPSRRRAVWDALLARLRGG